MEAIKARERRGHTVVTHCGHVGRRKQKETPVVSVAGVMGAVGVAHWTGIRVTIAVKIPPARANERPKGCHLRESWLACGAWGGSFQRKPWRGGLFLLVHRWIHSITDLPL